ncbi:MAG: hypothetical protein M3112_05290 [Actinomycetia bacterium]|nr:hypothetical protein [Actinomycetes bacterium]
MTLLVSASTCRIGTRPDVVEPQETPMTFALQLRDAEELGWWLDKACDWIGTLEPRPTKNRS